MATIQSYPVQIFPSGEVTPISGWIGGKAEAKIVVETFEDDGQPDPARILPNGKTALEDFFDFCKELNLPPLTDEEVDQVKCAYLMEKYG